LPINVPSIGDGDVRGQSDLLPRYCAIRRGGDDDSNVAGRNRHGLAPGYGVELIQQDLRRRDPGLIIGQKILSSDHAVLRNEIFAGKRNAVEGMTLWNIRIENSELADHNAALVGQTGVARLMRVAEAAQ